MKISGLPDIKRIRASLHVIAGTDKGFSKLPLTHTFELVRGHKWFFEEEECTEQIVREEAVSTIVEAFESLTGD